jgi:hypothetical protein
MSQPSDQPTLLELIDTELQAISAKLTNRGSVTGTTLATQIATLKTNIATTQTVMDLINDAGNAGTGLGPKASMPTSQDLETWLNAAIAAET